MELKIRFIFNRITPISKYFLKTMKRKRNSLNNSQWNFLRKVSSFFSSIANSSATECVKIRFRPDARALAATGKFFDDEHDDTEATLSPLSDSGALLIALVGRQVAWVVGTAIFLHKGVLPLPASLEMLLGNRRAA